MLLLYGLQLELWIAERDELPLKDRIGVRPKGSHRGQCFIDEFSALFKYQHLKQIDFLLHTSGTNANCYASAREISAVASIFAVNVGGRCGMTITEVSKRRDVVSATKVSVVS